MNTSRETVLQEVLNCIAKTTRYPAHILVPDASLEDDLGIDSVKRVEILAALKEVFQVDLEGPDTKAIRTIAQVADFVHQRVSAATPRQASAANGATAAAAPVATPAVKVVAPSPAHKPSAVTSAAPSSLPTSRVALAGQPAPAPVKPVVRAAPAPSLAATRPAVRAAAPVVMEARPAVTAAPLASREVASGTRREGALQGRIALVTGSGRALGRTVVETLAQRGATVIVNSFHSRQQGEETAAEIRAAGGDAVHIWGSIANESHVEALFEEIAARFGGLDILVCNASDGRIGSFMEMTQADFDRAFRTNIAGHHACASRAVPLMARRGGGAIVTMSTAGAHQYVRGFGCQGVVKAAVESLTRYLACELAPHNIRTNCVAAGPVYGELLQKLAEGSSALQHWEGMTPGGALCSPVDIARAIAFLVSDDAAAVNGAVWSVDRGFGAHVDGRLLAPGIDALVSMAAE